MSHSISVPGATCVGSAASATAARSHGRSSVLVALVAGTLFFSAFLMFLVEPMIARMVLPLLGGSPSVWNTCLVFFQTMLLGGYAYAHGATRYLGVRRHIVVHAVVLLLPLLVLPIGLHHAPPALPDRPAVWLLLALLGSIGLPFFVLSTSAAVLQTWFSATDDQSATDPYFLYAASNLGSFIALLAYPLIVEPTLRLQDQARLWTGGYAMLVALTLAGAAVAWRRGGATMAAVVDHDVDEPIAWLRRGRWIALAFVPSSLLLAVTTYISTDVASVPLLWILPLALYLLAFVLAFSPSVARVRAMSARLMPLLVVVLTLILVVDAVSPLSLIIPLHLAAFMAIAITCHSDLASDRPSPTQLTEFYFWIACGGMLGGMFNALLAPVIFSGIAEYPLVLVAACLLRAAPGPSVRRTITVADVAVPLAIGAAVAASILVNNRFGSQARFIMLGAAVPALFAFRQLRYRFRFAASIALILLAGVVTERQDQAPW